MAASLARASAAPAVLVLSVLAALLAFSLSASAVQGSSAGAGAAGGAAAQRASAPRALTGGPNSPKDGGERSLGDVCIGGVGCQLPDQQGHGAFGTVAATSDSNPNAGFSVAESFRVTELGVITHVCWWGVYFDFGQFASCSPTTVDSFTITYFRDDAGGLVPGSVKAGPFTVGGFGGLTGQVIMVGALVLPEYVYNADHEPVTVTPGECCWIEIQNSTTGDCVWLWTTAPPGDGRGAQAFAGAYGPADYDLAFCLNVAIEPDGCQFDDCNENGTADDWDIAVGPSEDCNEDGIPDECQLVRNDCNDDGVPDDCQLDGNDENHNYVLDECELDCEEFDRFEDLTANDTFTFTTLGHNPQQERGFAYAYAVDAQGQGIGFDHLLGQVLVVDGLEVFEYSMNAVDYGAMVAELAPTDLAPGDGVRDLNGLEYEKTAGEILVPRFLGQDGVAESELILIGLSGGSEFETTVDFLVYNDNEEQFSAQHTFRCWDRAPLTRISGLFTNEFLATYSGDDPDEDLGDGQEYGWFRVSGDHASSSFYDVIDPAVYAVLIEEAGGVAAADLPFETCTQSGHLFPRLVTGDDEEVLGAPSDQDCEQSVTRLDGGSLLLYPEFDNREGVMTVYTITNASESLGVRVHFVYIGRYR